MSCSEYATGAGMAAKLFVTVLALCLLALVSRVWGSEPLPRFGIFVYSSLCSDAAGDVGGHSLILKRTPKGDKLTYAYGAGPLEGSDIEDLRVRGDYLTATVVTDEGERARLSATLGEREAVLTEEPDHPAPVRQPPGAFPACLASPSASPTAAKAACPCRS